MSTTETDELRQAATAARSAAYAPYSEFDAGAAVLTTAGTVHRGALVENISLGLSMCAERIALFSAATAGERPGALALAAPATDGGTTLPCGACLQVALELGGPDVRVIAVGSDDIVESTVGELLPRGPARSETGIES